MQHKWEPLVSSHPNLPDNDTLLEGWASCPNCGKEVYLMQSGNEAEFLDIENAMSIQSVDPDCAVVIAESVMSF